MGKISYLFYRIKHRWERHLAQPWRRQRFLLDCYIHGVSVVLPDDTIFAHPVRVWGVGGQITIERDVHFAMIGGSPWLGPIGFEMRTEESRITLSQGVWVMRASRFICVKSITVRSGVTIGDGCLLLDSDIHDFTPGAWDKPMRGSPIVIEERAHLAPNVTVLKGVTIGADSVVGNHSVVQRSLPSRSVALGTPARIVLRFTQPLIEKQ